MTKRIPSFMLLIFSLLVLSCSKETPQKQNKTKNKNIVAEKKRKDKNHSIYIYSYNNISRVRLGILQALYQNATYYEIHRAKIRGKSRCEILRCKKRPNYGTKIPHYSNPDTNISG